MFCFLKQKISLILIFCESGYISPSTRSLEILKSVFFLNNEICFRKVIFPNKIFINDLILLHQLLLLLLLLMVHIINLIFLGVVSSYVLCSINLIKFLIFIDLIDKKLIF